MLPIIATDAWRAAHPGAAIGLLEVSSIDNSQPSDALNQRKRDTEAQLRTRYANFTRPDFIALPIMAAYRRYYKRFNKTYHVQLQVESLVLKGKHLPDVSPLVDAYFIAEVETFVLTAGHDVDKLKGSVTIDVSHAGDEITQMNGTRKPIRPGDMVMRDADAVACSIIYGQDNRSPITPATTHALYVIYAPEGVAKEAVLGQMQLIAALIGVFSSTAVVEQQRILRASA